MIAMDDVHPASAGQRSQAGADCVNLSAAAATLIGDASAKVGRSRLAQLGALSLRRLLKALHDSRRLESERVLTRYRHLIGRPDDQAQ
jgi:hypothetical protein